MEDSAFFIHSRITHGQAPGSLRAAHPTCPTPPPSVCWSRAGSGWPHRMLSGITARVAYIDEYRGLAFESAEGDRLAAAMGDNDVAFLGAHGVIVTGPHGLGCLRRPLLPGTGLPIPVHRSIFRTAATRNSGVHRQGSGSGDAIGSGDHARSALPGHPAHPGPGRTGVCPVAATVGASVGSEAVPLIAFDPNDCDSGGKHQEAGS